MENIKNRIKNIANKYNLQLAYVFGNRAKQALKLVEGKVKNLPPGTSDLDIGISRISLFLMRKAAEFLPYERMRQKIILGEEWLRKNKEKMNEE